MTNEQQRITFSGSPRGSYRLGFRGEMCDPPLNHSSSAADMTVALLALNSVGAGDLIVVSSGAGTYDVYFANDLAGRDLPLLDVDDSGLSRGSITVSPLVEGGEPPPPEPPPEEPPLEEPPPSVPGEPVPVVWVAPSGRDMTREYMMAQLGARGINGSWTSAVPTQRPSGPFFTIEDLNSATEYGPFADAQLIQIRSYYTDQDWLTDTMRLIKGLWKVMPVELKVQSVEHAGGPTYDDDPDVPGLRYGQVISWVTVMTEVM